MPWAVKRNIAKEICEADAEYVLALKGNHETVHEEVASFLENARQKDWKKVPHDFLETIEKAHGRLETRRYWITEAIDWFADRGQWEGLRSMGMVESIRQMGENSSSEIRFFLCSIKADAKEFAKAVRGHWSIENNLHWVLDVCFREDQCRARAGHAAQNLAILRQIALNTLKRDILPKTESRDAKKPQAGMTPISSGSSKI